VLHNALLQKQTAAGTAAALPVLHSKRLLTTRRPSAAFDGGLWDNGHWTDGQPLVSDSPLQSEHPEVDDEDETGSPPAARRLRFRGASASSSARELR
jgi:hypothetical protein